MIEIRNLSNYASKNEFLNPALEWIDDDYLSMRIDGFDLHLEKLSEVSNKIINDIEVKIMDLLQVQNLDFVDKIVQIVKKTEKRENGENFNFKIKEILDFIPSFDISKFSFLFFFFFFFCLFCLFCFFLFLFVFVFFSNIYIKLICL